MIVYVDDFKLAGPADKLQVGWDLIRGPSKVAPNGIDMDPPTTVGRFLGCEHVVSEKWIDWHGEEPTVLDPPPLKTKKVKTLDSAPAELGLWSLGCQTHHAFCDRSYPVPPNESVWVRYDAAAKRYKASLPDGGPDWRDVVRRVTLDVDSWDELEDLSKPHNADHNRIFARIPGGAKKHCHSVVLS